VSSNERFGFAELSCSSRSDVRATRKIPTPRPGNCFRFVDFGQKEAVIVDEGETKEQFTPEGGGTMAVNPFGSRHCQSGEVESNATTSNARSGFGVSRQHVWADLYRFYAYPGACPGEAQIVEMTA